MLVCLFIGHAIKHVGSWFSDQGWNLGPLHQKANSFFFLIYFFLFFNFTILYWFCHIST